MRHVPIFVLDNHHWWIDLLLSAAPVESHIGAIVVSIAFVDQEELYVYADSGQDSPNACVTLGIPTGIFEYARRIDIYDRTDL